MSHKLPRILHCTTGIVLPKIDAMAEPIVVIHAGLEVRLSSEDLFGDGFIAAMKTQNERGKYFVHDLEDYRYGLASLTPPLVRSQIPALIRRSRATRGDLRAS